uniref:Protein JTB n=1 Tax=Dracunculus medinensis TaxID=318479 RepID=A0A0N4UHF1_DRAME
LNEYLCFEREKFVLIQECIPCSAFEIKALKTPYCEATGYYDKLNCTSSRKLGYKPCYTKIEHINKNLFLFTIFSSGMTIFSYSFVSWRRSVLERRSYFRIRQQIGS